MPRISVVQTCSPTTLTDNLLTYLVKRWRRLAKLTTTSVWWTARRRCVPDGAAGEISVSRDECGRRCDLSTRPYDATRRDATRFDAMKSLVARVRRTLSRPVERIKRQVSVSPDAPLIDRTQVGRDTAPTDARRTVIPIAFTSASGVDTRGRRLCDAVVARLPRAAAAGTEVMREVTNRLGCFAAAEQNSSTMRVYITADVRSRLTSATYITFTAGSTDRLSCIARYVEKIVDVFLCEIYGVSRKLIAEEFV